MASAIFKNVMCAQCGEQEAMVFIRRSGGPSEGCDMVLCESCAGRRGISAGKGGLELNMDDLIGVGLDANRADGKPAFCPSCGLELAALRREGRLGCSVCADTFYDEIIKVVGHREGVALEPRMAEPSRLVPPPSLLASDDAARLRLDLKKALASENYEEAARLRDELSCIRSPVFPASACHFDPTALGPGPDDDVVLASSARLCRDLVGPHFPGSPRGPSAPSRSMLLDKIRGLESWSAQTMSELSPAARRSYSERGIVPRGYAADDEAVLLSQASLRGYALLDEGDHLRVRALLPGLAVEAALAQAFAAIDTLGRELAFAFKPGIGWICSRIVDCGLGCSLSATLHLPALAAAGMRDRLFRALLAEGLSIRGFYSSREESAGAVYEIGIESSNAPTAQAMAVFFAAAIARVVAAERRARSEISEHSPGLLVDAEGRAFGVTRYFRLAGGEEAASLLSVLRLAALRGSLSGADYRVLGALIMALGSGSIAQASGLGDIPSAGEQEILRADIVRQTLAKAEYRSEEGFQCSKD